MTECNYIRQNEHILIIDFVIPCDSGVNTKENEKKIGKYHDAARELRRLEDPDH